MRAPVNAGLSPGGGSPRLEMFRDADRLPLPRDADPHAAVSTHLDPGPFMSRTQRGALLVAFFLSGAAGLAYELIWSRYLGLLLGASAFAQVAVIAVYLGGMAGGALMVGNRSVEIRRPLRAYALAELALAAAGIAFHPLFRGATALFYGTLLPALATPLLVAVVKWSLAVLLILSQSLILGATFPLLSASLVRAFPREAGRTVADLYLWNSLGGAAGVLLTGFVVVAAWGTPGALLVAAGGNLLAAGVAWRVGDPARTAGRPPPEAPEKEEEGSPHMRRKTTGDRLNAKEDEVLWRLLLGVSFLTAMASFMYEVGWIRMLSMLMGGATHAFELMLSAFILGLAVGSFLIRRRADATGSPLELLGIIQWVMGATALVSLPLYAGSFEISAYLAAVFPRFDSGYALYNLARYGLALSIMLPSAVMAGMTLPLITGVLLRRGLGERSVGWVYGMNTFGSVTGVLAAGLILLPLLGLKGLIVAGGCIDMALGAVILLTRRRAETGRKGRSWLGPAAAVAGGIGVFLTLTGVHLDKATLTGGVFRYGRVPTEEEREVLFYHDGRTASVGVHLLEDEEAVVLTTNGKPDASLPIRWIVAAATDTVAPQPITHQDASTQVLAPLVTLAHAPDARRIANIGHGSGMSAQAFLASPEVEQLVTVEIEPTMVRASTHFLPANRRPFEDSRHRFVFDDARSYFAHQQRRFGVIFSEPSNPWVSGVSNLFTVEFYRRIRMYLEEDGVFAQWIQLYEMSDALVLTVLEAVHESFGDYRAFLVGDSDLLVVATPARNLPDPDWGIFDLPKVRQDLSHVEPFLPNHLQSLRVFERRDLAPLLDPASGAVNSDFHPHLDLGAEKARFNYAFASGIYSLATRRFDLLGAIRGDTRARGGYHPVPAPGLEPLRNRALSAWLAEHSRGEALPVETPYPEWGRRLSVHWLFLDRLASAEPPEDWRRWAELFHQLEGELHQGTVGWADAEFFGAARRFVERTGAPETIRAAVAFHRGMASWDRPLVIDAAEVLFEATGDAPPLVPPETLLEVAALAYLETGEEGKAGRALEALRNLLSNADLPRLRLRILEARLNSSAESHPPRP